MSRPTQFNKNGPSKNRMTNPLDNKHNNPKPIYSRPGIRRPYPTYDPLYYTSDRTIDSNITDTLDNNRPILLNRGANLRSNYPYQTDTGINQNESTLNSLNIIKDLMSTSIMNNCKSFKLLQKYIDVSNELNKITLMQLETKLDKISSQLSRISDRQESTYRYNNYKQPNVNRPIDPYQYQSPPLNNYPDHNYRPINPNLNTINSCSGSCCNMNDPSFLPSFGRKIERPKKKEKNKPDKKVSDTFNGMTIHFDDLNISGSDQLHRSLTNDVGNNTPSTASTADLLGPFSFLSPILFKSFDINGDSTKESNDIQNESEPEDVIVYNSADEFEELDLKLDSLDDMIKLGAMYDDLKKTDKQVATDNPLEDKDKCLDNQSPPSSSSTDIFDESTTDSDILDNKDNKDNKEDKEDKEDKDNKDSQSTKSDQNIDICNIINCLDQLLGTSTPKPMFSSKKKKVSFKDKEERPRKKTKKDRRDKRNNKLEKDLDMLEQQQITAPNKQGNSEFKMNGKRYPINLLTLNKLIKPLTKLKSMIGLDKVKNSIMDMIIYYLQGFENTNKNMLHTIIEGPPGVGKTELGKIMAEIYSALGVIPSNKFKMVKRKDLIGEYVGQTAPKTQKVIDEAEGGILFIDEAYSLGNKDKKDSFSKECIDTINQNLSENKKKFICIIAGYPNELEECFFSSNPGLRRRFPFKFTIDGYQPAELKNIFMKKINDSKWNVNSEDLDQDSLLKFFETNHTNFPNFGGDIDNLLVDCKFMHSRRVLGKHPKFRRNFIKEDIDKGLERFKSNRVKDDFIKRYIRDTIYM